MASPRVLAYRCSSMEQFLQCLQTGSAHLSRMAVLHSMISMKERLTIYHE